MTTTVLERTGFSDTRRIVKEGKIVALVQKLSNGQWGLYDPDDDRRLTPETFRTPKASLQWWQRIKT
jgi:hypothetical protein